MTQDPFADLVPQQSQAGHDPFADLVPQNQPQTFSLDQDPSLLQKTLVGIGRGVTDIGESAKQLGLLAGEKLGMVPQGTSANYTKQADQERALYDKTPIGQSFTGEAARFGTNALPYILTPAGEVGAGLTAGKALAARFGANAATNAAISAGQFVPEQGSRASNAALGGLIGGAIPEAGKAILGAGAKAYNAIKGITNDPVADAVIQSGIKHNVRVFPPDVGGPTMKTIAQGLEEVPLLGMRAEREGQMVDAKNAALKVQNDLQSKMLNSDYMNLDRIKQVAQSGDPRRANAAQNILSMVDNAGDDWQKIIETSGNLKLFNNKLTADDKYTALSNAANKYGAVSAPSTLKAINNAIDEAKASPLPNQSLINDLGSLNDYFTGNALDYSRLRDAMGKIGAKASEFYSGKNSLIGSEGAGYFQGIKNGIKQDLDNFAQKNGDELKTLWKDADSFYQKNVAPYKDAQLAKALSKGAPDEIYSQFVKFGETEGGKGTTRASRFYNALDDKGQAAVRYGMITNAMDKALTNDGKMFSPGSFAHNLNRIASSKGVFFKGDQKAEIDGFNNLMEHVARSSQALVRPETGTKVTPYLISLMAGGGAMAAPGATATAAASAFVLKNLMTSNWGRRILLASSKLKPGSEGIERIYNRAMQKLGTATAVNATN